MQTPRYVWTVGLALCLFATACEEDFGGGDAEDGGDAREASDTGEPDTTSPDGGDAAETDVGPAGGEFADELRRPVEVITDDYGMRHIYAESLKDLFFMNGYMYAKDRFGQMEFFRRVATGTLAEVLGKFDKEPIRTDVMMRTLGLKRSAEKFWKNNYDPDKEGFQVVEAYCRGVNTYLEQREQGEVEESDFVAQLFPPEHTREWEPSDVLAVGKLLAVQLTYIADPEIDIHQFRDSILSNFTSDASDPDLAARSGLLEDVLRFAPATDTTHIDGFPDSGSALKTASKRPVVDPSVIDNALQVHRGLTEMPLMEGNPILAENRLGTGSNNWTLSGSRTSSGHPNVANDPHLGLTLPSIFYPLHLRLENDIEGREPFEAVGGALLGIPGVVIGRTRDVAWGSTVGFYDYVDVYRETLTAPSNGSETPKVEFEGQKVEVEQITEEIKVGGLGKTLPEDTIELNLEVVPHHGPILPTLNEDAEPVPRTKNEALSIKWVGLEPNNDLQFLMDLYRAEEPADVEEALDHYTVGSSNFVFGFTNGDIYYSGQSNIPDRPQSAMTFDAESNPEGNSPTFILPGDGTAEWEGFVPEENIPHAKNPDNGYIVTANNDQVGVTLDNDPFDDKEYLGGLYPNGFRATRITNLIEQPSKVGNGDQKLSLDEQVAIQNDGKDMVASRVVPHMLDAVETVLDENVPDSETPDLAATRQLVQDRSNGAEELKELRDLLEAWDYIAPGTRSPSGKDATRSSAATLFNTAMVYLLRGVFRDEFTVLGRYNGGNFDIPFGAHMLSRVLIWSLEKPEEAATYDAQVGDVLLFDDMRTDDRTETRIFQIIRAMYRAKDRLASDEDLTVRFDRPIPSPASSNPDDWVWGKVHGLRLGSLLPFGKKQFRRPKEGLPFYPRPGGQFAVSPCNHSYDDFDFTCSSGSSLRMVHDMDPEDPVTYNAIPGGYSMDPDSETYMSEFERWQQPDPRKLETDPEVLREDARSVEQFGPGTGE